jgi:hypothetical protein
MTRLQKLCEWFGLLYCRHRLILFVLVFPFLGVVFGVKEYYNDRMELG